MAQSTEKPKENDVRGNLFKALGRVRPRPLTEKKNKPELGTGAWLTHTHGPPTSPENAKYRRWRSSQSGEVFWVCGDAGTGKSSLAQLLVRDLQVDQSNVVLSFGFDACSEPTVNSPAELLLSILGELIVHPKATPSTDGKLVVSNLLGQEAGLILGSRDRVPMESAWRVFETLICCQHSCFLVIDALDECISFTSEQNTTVPGVDLLRRLTQLTKRSNLKLACFSRNQPSLVPLMQEFTCITLRADLVMSDILTCFLREYDRDTSLPPGCRERAKKRVLRTADGSFMWTRVLARYAKMVEKDEAINLRLEVCPPRLHDAYERMLLETSRLGEFGEEETRLRRAIFAFLLGAQAPVTLSMLVDALGIPESDAGARLDLLCKPLVYISESQVGLCHSSARDFVLGLHPRVTATMPPITLVESHQFLTRKCLERLLPEGHGSCHTMGTCAHRERIGQEDGMRFLKQQDEQSNFYRYAADYWVTHLMAVPEPDEGLLKLASALLGDLEFSHWAGGEEGKAMVLINR